MSLWIMWPAAWAYVFKHCTYITVTHLNLTLVNCSLTNHFIYASLTQSGGNRNVYFFSFLVVY